MKRPLTRLVYLSLALVPTGFLEAQEPLILPPVMTGPIFDLHLETGTRSFLPGPLTNTMGVNGDILGPTLILNAGDMVTMLVTNDLPESTTIHWHGLHVPAAADGGPHTVIQAGEVWMPQFQVLDKAGTYWYHPHLHMKTAEHVTKGLAGFIIVRDDEESALDLPRQYGVDDFPVAIQSRGFDVNNQFLVGTAADSLILTNGVRNATLAIPAQIIRFRLLNGSTERIFRLGFEDDLPFHLIATDGGLVSSPVVLDRLNLAPGERAEILVDLTGRESTSLNLNSYASELASGNYGAATPGIMPMGSIPGYDNNPLNGEDFPILHLTIGPQTDQAVTVVPSTLVTPVIIPEADAQTTRQILFQPKQMGMNAMLNGPFVFNGSSFDIQKINEEVPLGNTEIWELTNMTAIAHPFHIHDVQFRVLDINGAPPLPEQSGRKDVILVPPGGGTVRFITRFEDYADPMIPYMYHCHMLTHEDAGMMGQFLVTGSTALNSPGIHDHPVIFPNPATDILTFRIVEPWISGFSATLFDAHGRVCGYTHPETVGTFDLPVGHLPSGPYMLRLISKDGTIHSAPVLINSH